MHIALTGASGGLGGALALAYAAPGIRLSLAGRDPERLAAVAAACRARGADARTAAFDVRDHAALENWLRNSDADAPLDICFANAGVTASAGASGVESPADLVRLLEVNAVATLLAAGVAAELMGARGSGQLALISSLAARLPMPAAPAYAAGKAAARLYGLSLRRPLRARGVRVTVVSPGYIDTPMTGRLSGAKPFLWPPERAAAHIKKRLRGAPAEIAFPRPLALGIRMLSWLPSWAAGPLLDRFSYTVAPDDDSLRASPASRETP